VAIHSGRIEVPRNFPEPSGRWVLESLTDATVIFGRNGSGKSQLLRLIRDQDKPRKHYASPERGGTINLNPSYMMEEYTAESRGSRRTGNTAPTYRDEGVARVQALLAKRGNHRTEPVPVPPQDLEALMNTLLPAFSFQILSGQQAVQLTRTSNGQQVSSVDQLSSGEAALYALGLDLVTICGMWALDGQKEGMLLVDEPDLHLHPDLQQHLASFVLHLIDVFPIQILVATHSTTLLSALGHYGGTRTSVIYLDPTKEVQTATPFTDVAQQLANILGGHALMGPLFAVPILLVEGDDDYKVWSHAVRHHRLQLAVVACEGSRLKEYETTLNAVFAALIEKPRPLAYGLHDLDDRAKQPKQRESFVVSLWLNCREVENLYLTSEVLHLFDLDAAAARSKILERAGDFGQKADQLRAIANEGDWRRVDLKGAMNQLSEILDPKRVDWAIRLGTVIGKERPVGELADFLGDQVVKAFWQPAPQGEPAAAAAE
jgi:predicted ATPase